MIDIEFLENSGYFEKINIKAGDILFNEGDIDENLYIIKKGSVFIKKYTSSDKTETKIIAQIGELDIFGEGALGDSEPKQVTVVANQDTELLKIEAKVKFEEFLQKNTKKGIQLLSSIIYIGNKRLLEANFLITLSYRINKYISEITKFNNINLFSIINELSETINCKYIIYIEKNNVIPNIGTIKYDTRLKGKMKQDIIELKNDNIDIEYLKNEGLSLSNYNLVDELKNGNKVIGYLIIGKENSNFDEGEKKSIGIISVSIAGFIKQKEYIEEKNINYYNE
ncbi:MAG: cyclic nucleotide-binding domain-containing protein [Candidatus Gracilibacteria bacterium]|nr:cyclic nucleotide-binding domain-containing protein [Candidatus Gracilibacteria bacterium]